MRFYVSVLRCDIIVRKNAMSLIPCQVLPPGDQFLARTCNTAEGADCASFEMADFPTDLGRQGHFFDFGPKE